MIRLLVVVVVLLLSVGGAQAQTYVWPSQRVPVNSSTVSSANTAVTHTITGVQNRTIRIESLSAYCSAGTSSITITDGGTTTWRSPTGFISTSIVGVAWPVPYTSNAPGNTVVVTLATCGSSNTGTLNVQHEMY